jgi:hypothetical protein
LLAEVVVGHTICLLEAEQVELEVVAVADVITDHR